MALDPATAISAGSGLVSSAIGMIGQRTREKRAMRNQEHLMDIQQKNQMGLNQQAKDLALQQWKDTNYSAQVGEIEKAGLNVGMIYGGSGAGGATAQTGSGGGASGGQAPAPQPMNIEGLNTAMQLAQIEMMKSQANKNNADAEKTKGVDTELGGANVANTQAQTALTNLQSENQKLQNNLTTKNTEEIINTIYANARKAEAEAGVATVQSNIATDTQKDAIKQIKAEAIGALLRNVLTKEQIQYTDAQTNAIADQIATAYINAYANQRNANSNERNSESQLVKQIKDAMYQNGVLELGDRKLNQEMIFGISSLLMGQAPQTTTRSTESWDSHGNTRSTSTTETRNR